MALGTATAVAKQGRDPSQALGLFLLAFAGDGAYPSGGTASFQDYVRAAIGQNCTVLGVVDVALNATYYPVYDSLNDKLKVYVRATGVENATADISAQLFRVLVIGY